MPMTMFKLRLLMATKINEYRILTVAVIDFEIGIGVHDISSPCQFLTTQVLLMPSFGTN